MCGSSSWLVHVTVLPARTVNVVGAKAKLSMLTESPPTAAGELVADVPAGAPVIGGIGLMPGIPGVPLAAEPKVIDGCASCRDAEHPASTSTLTANTATVGFRNMAIVMPGNRAVGYTAQAGAAGLAGANTSIAPLTSRTINVGNGFGAIGN